MLGTFGRCRSAQMMPRRTAESCMSTVCAARLVPHFAGGLLGISGFHELVSRRLPGLRSPLGIAGRASVSLGNFPQAFSHIGLVTTAHVIEAKRTGLRICRSVRRVGWGRNS